MDGPVTAYIGLGSNIGDCEQIFRQAMEELKRFPRILSVTCSSFLRSTATGPIEQDDFLNAVARVRTTALPYQLLEILQAIENKFDRQRKEKWGPRTLDLDLLLYEDDVLNEPDLVIPHPQLHLRSFVLTGMCELASRVVHPVLGNTMQQLYQRLNGSNYWIDPQRPQLISITGNIGVGKTTLATELAKRMNAKFIAENYDDNPYLPDVYAGNTELALDSELFFLSSGASQLCKDRLDTSCCYISDYVFDKALIYASGWLKDSDLEIYRKHYESVRTGVVDPILVIYMIDTIENCLDRIHRRNRPYEQQIEMPFLEHLANGYDALYTDYRVCPVIRIRPDQCRTAEQVDHFAEQIRYYIAGPQK